MLYCSFYLSTGFENVSLMADLLNVAQNLMVIETISMYMWCFYMMFINILSTVTKIWKGNRVVSVRLLSLCTLVKCYSLYLWNLSWNEAFFDVLQVAFKTYDNLYLLIQAYYVYMYIYMYIHRVYLISYYALFQLRRP